MTRWTDGSKFEMASGEGETVIYHLLLNLMTGTNGMQGKKQKCHQALHLFTIFYV
jgi:hypothetical protein